MESLNHFLTRLQREAGFSLEADEDSVMLTCPNRDCLRYNATVVTIAEILHDAYQVQCQMENGITFARN